MATMTTLPRVSAKAKQYVNEVMEFGFHNTRSLDFCGQLEQAFADKFGRRFGILHANGTVTMQSALMAAGILLSLFPKHADWLLIMKSEKIQNESLAILLISPKTGANKHSGS